LHSEQQGWNQPRHHNSSVSAREWASPCLRCLVIREIRAARVSRAHPALRECLQHGKKKVRLPVITPCACNLVRRAWNGRRLRSGPCLEARAALGCHVFRVCLAVLARRECLRHSGKACSCVQIVEIRMGTAK
jgi:hypothetical protein